MKSKKYSRLIYFIGFLISAGAVLIAILLQIKDNLSPCPLCVLQRIGFLGVALFTLIATFHGPLKRIANVIYSSLILLFAIFGGLVAIRQVFLEVYPSDAPHGCGIGIGYMFHNLPLQDFLMLMFNGTSDCAAMQWSFLGLSMAFWSIILFIILFILYFLNVLRHIISFKK